MASAEVEPLGAPSVVGDPVADPSAEVDHTASDTSAVMGSDTYYLLSLLRNSLSFNAAININN